MRQRMRWVGCLILLTFILKTQSAHANLGFWQPSCTREDCVTTISIDSLLPVIGMHDMQGDRWIVQVSPGYWMADNVLVTKGQSTLGPQQAESGFRGYSGALAVKREFSPHWGAGLMGSFAVQQGQRDIGGITMDLAPTNANTSTPGGAGIFPGGTLKGIYGNQVAAVATYDPFSEGFRLPISFGPYYLWQGYQFTHSFINPNNGAAQTESADVTYHSVGVVANVSADFVLFKKIRIAPALFAAATKLDFSTPLVSFNYKVTQNGIQKSYSNAEYMMANYAIAYLNLGYLPWSIDFNYVLINGIQTGSNNDPVAFKSQVFSLTWTKKWGGKSDVKSDSGS